MKTSDQIILVLVLLPTAFVMGNLTHDSFDIKSTMERMFQKPIVTNAVKQNQQTPIVNSVRPTVKTVTSVTANNLTNTIRQLPQTLIKKIGETYTLGNMEYKVISAVNNGTTYNYSKTTGKFIVVKILVKNTGKINSSVSKILIKDKNDRQYNTSGFMDGVFINDGTEYGSGYDGMAPGFSETYRAVFKVAKDSTDLRLCHPSTTGEDLVCVQLGL